MCILQSLTPSCCSVGCSCCGGPFAEQGAGQLRHNGTFSSPNLRINSRTLSKGGVEAPAGCLVWEERRLLASKASGKCSLPSALAWMARLGRLEGPKKNGY